MVAPTVPPGPLDQGPYRDEIVEAERQLYEVTQGIESLSTVPRHNLWKLLFMERKYIENGKFYYEAEEPGYLLGLMRGYLRMLQTLNDPLTVDLYCELHDITCGPVTTEDFPEGIPIGLRGIEAGGEGFQVIWGETISDAGYSELMARRKSYSYVDPETGDAYEFLRQAMRRLDRLERKPDERSFFCLRPTRPETSRCNLNACFGFYQRNRENGDGLRAIVRLVQDCDQLHVHSDGNIRNTAILLLTRELLLSGQEPSVLQDVNIFDALSEDELIAAVLEGQTYFRNHVVTA